MNETDPNGLNAHTPGAKLDAGKPRVALVLGDFAGALLEVAKVGTFGANKYSPHGWLQVDKGQERYDDAMMRHWLLSHSGELLDPQTALLHAAHEAWNSLAKLQLMINEMKSNQG
jgi:hypothetical protein